VNEFLRRRFLRPLKDYWLSDEVIENHPGRLRFVPTRKWPAPVEDNKRCLDICIGPKIHYHVFATLQSLQPVKTLLQNLNFSCQVRSNLGFRLRPFSLFLSTRDLR